MEHPWLQSYPPGVPAVIADGGPVSLGTLLADSVARHARRTAFLCMGSTLSYAELDEQSRRLAGYFQALGLQRGARIALMLPNVLQYPVALFAILRAGYIVVNCNPLYTERELEYQLADAGAEAIVVLENFAHVVQQALPGAAVRHVIVTALGDMFGLLKGTVVNAVARHVKHLVPAWRIDSAVPWRAALARGQVAGCAAADVGRDDIAFLQYTGGTTGVAKGAMLTHGNLLANLQQARLWIGAALHEGEEVVITALPLYHIFSLTANCLTFLQLGATNVLIPNPRDIPGFVRELGRHRFTVITGVNTLYNALLNHPDFARLDFSGLKVSLGGGMAVQAAVAARWRTVTGCTLSEAYGLTETSPAVTINPLDLREFSGSIGLPLPGTDVTIRDDAGHDLPPGQVGELCVRGPQLMAGYWQRPEETAEAMTPDGFLRTGDIATMDAHGYVYLVDRKKDTILVSGFNVYPNEVETVLMLHPGVVEVAVVGVPDERSGEAVKACIVRRDVGLTSEALIAHCRQHLAAYKVPHRIEFHDDLPKTNVGKILRRALR